MKFKISEYHIRNTQNIYKHEVNHTILTAKHRQGVKTLENHPDIKYPVYI